LDSNPLPKSPNDPPEGAIPDDMPEEVAAAYRAGRTTFMGVTLRVAPGVLVPRPETELLGRAVLDYIGTVRSNRPAQEPVRIIDLCCGSGNLACGLAAAVPSAQAWAADLTDQCVELTRRNVQELGLQDRVRVFQGDLFAPLASEGLEGVTDVIVCNPPYIPTAMLATRDDLRHEPREAFDGGPYGLSVLMRVLREAPRYLRPGGGLFLEVGPREESQARDLLQRARNYENVEVIRDASGTVRCVHGRLKSS
jgi:release factor glutamine methyltransferase